MYRYTEHVRHTVHVTSYLHFSAKIHSFPLHNSMNVRKIYHRGSVPALQTGHGSVPTAEDFPVVSRSQQDHFHLPVESGLTRLGRHKVV